MKLIATALAALTIAAAWAAGEQHRANCLTAGRTSCSILPWDNGHTTGTTRVLDCITAERLARATGKDPDKAC